MKQPKITSAILLLLVGGACGEEKDSQSTLPPGSVELSDPNPTPIPDNDPNCEVFKVGLPALDTSWLTSQIALGSCSDAAPVVLDVDGQLTNTVLYATCEEPGSSPAQCVLDVEMQLCLGGHWTKLCQKNADCPLGTVCLWPNGTGDVPSAYDPPFGTCEKTCSMEGSVQCGRCDLECNTYIGACAVKPDNTM